jgi:phosphate-selective porin OprO and OprP
MYIYCLALHPQIGIIRMVSLFYKWMGIASWVFFVVFTVNGQVELDERPLIEIEDGISFSKEDKFLLNLRFRMQNRFGFNTISGTDLRPEKFEARVRRLRLRFDGYVVNKKLQYYIQLSFSRADQDLETGTVAQTIRDAILYYTFSDNFYIGFGQSKLPGNRQRVNSSGNLQFADRSIVNQRYNIDRDFGFFGYYTARTGEGELRLKGAVTTGDGRNALAIDEGLAYTGRIEWLPLGIFTNNGDFSEGDLEREVSPKLSLAATLSFNHKAARTGGQLGGSIPEPRDITTWILDAVFKYKGWAISTEYLNRFTEDPVFESNSQHPLIFMPAGQGWNTQFSYVLPKSDTEFAVRWAMIRPVNQVLPFDTNRNECLIGYNRYLNGHRIKIQGNVGYNWVTDNFSERGQVVGVFQVEFGI